MSIGLNCRTLWKRNPYDGDFGTKTNMLKGQNFYPVMMLWNVVETE